MIRTTVTNKTKKKASPKGNRDNDLKMKSKKVGSDLNKKPAKANPLQKTIDKSLPKPIDKLIEHTANNKPIPIPKLERSNSFFLTRKLSKIYNSLTGSKDSLNKIPENETNTQEPPNPFKFTRSASLATIPLRRSYRQTIRESKLEQLREEEGQGHTTAAKENETITANNVNAHLPVLSIENLDRKSAERKNSFSLMSSLKRTFSVTPARKKSYNPRWSASLISLQQIDSMISYEDLSFINYDKFNTYEANLKRNMSQTNVNAKHTNRKSMTDDNFMFNGISRRNSSLAHTISYERPTSQPIPNTNSAFDQQPQYFTNYPEVKRRIPKRISINDQHKDNFDKRKNVYRQSLDCDKLQLMNRKSYRWSNPCDNFNINSTLITSDPSNSKTDISIKSNNVDDCIDAKVNCIDQNGQKMIQRCISCNSLRRTQSMNDVNDSNRNLMSTILAVSNLNNNLLLLLIFTSFCIQNIYLHKFIEIKIAKICVLNCKRYTMQC